MNTEQILVLAVGIVTIALVLLLFKLKLVEVPKAINRAGIASGVALIFLGSVFLLIV